MEKYITKTFKDYKGITHVVTGYCYCCKTEGAHLFQLGWACQHPNDKVSTSLAKTIAENRTASDKGNVITVKYSGFILNRVENFIDYILEMYVDYLIDNPGIMITGYRKGKKKFEEAVKKL